MTLAAVLFDLDGVLVDSEPLWTVAEEELAAGLGVVWSGAVKAAVLGTRLEAAVPQALELLGVEVTAAAVMDASGFLLTRMAELFRLDLPVFEGALELVDAVRAAGMRTALVSSSYRILVDAALERLGTHRFDVSVAGDEVPAGKPAPDAYLQACRTLGVPPGDTVVLEDSLAGVVSAEAAGCAVVAVAGVVPVPQTPGRAVVRSLLEVELPWLLSCRPAGRAPSADGDPRPA